ncbi:MAG: hypothetical protein GY705_07030, partial [Bacteroidetes bacterium]|nr:hypothetical protein [Bacteroidota bacterium]
TPEGVEKLFPKIEFDTTHRLASTSKDGELYRPDTEVGKIKFSSKTHIKNTDYLKAVSVKILRGFSKIGIFRWIVGYRYVLTPTMINMTGKLLTKKK